MNNTLPLVSVLIPCYNAEKYVEQALRSIMNQSYTNLEIIAADDCSTDNTLTILKTLAAEDNRIRIVNNPVNLKIVKTLNTLIDLANGKYIARMDADDISLPDRILKQVRFMEKHPDYAICGTNAYHINEGNEITGFSYLPITNKDIQKYKVIYSPFYHPSILIRSDILKKNKFKESYLYAEDYELWIRILKNYKGYNLRNYLFAYRVYSEQTSSKKRDIQIEVTKKILHDNEDLIDSEKIDFLINFITNEKDKLDFRKYRKCLKKGLPKRYLTFTFRIHQTKSIKCFLKNIMYVFREAPYLVEFYFLKFVILKKKLDFYEL